MYEHVVCLSFNMLFFILRVYILTLKYLKDFFPQLFEKTKRSSKLKK